MNWRMALSVVLQLLGLVLERVKASNDTVNLFKALIEATRNDGLISQTAADKFKRMHEELIEKIKDEGQK